MKNVTIDIHFGTQWKSNKKQNFHCVWFHSLTTVATRDISIKNKKKNIGYDKEHECVLSYQKYKKLTIYCYNNNPFFGYIMYISLECININNNSSWMPAKSKIWKIVFSTQSSKVEERIIIYYRIFFFVYECNPYEFLITLSRENLKNSK